MRSNAVLVVFRTIAVLLMLLGVLHAMALVLTVFTNGGLVPTLDDLVDSLTYVPLYCGMPIFTFSLGSILFVLVEIALRSRPPQDDA